MDARSRSLPKPQPDLWLDTSEDGLDVIFPSGTSFPASPRIGQAFYRTDIRGGMLFRWNGTRWLSEQVFQVFGGTQAAQSSPPAIWHPLPPDFAIWVERMDTVAYVSSAATWTIVADVHHFDNNLIDTLVSRSTAGQTGAKLYHYTDLIGVEVDGTGGNVSNEPIMFRVTITEVSGAATFYGQGLISYRLIAT